MPRTRHEAAIALAPLRDLPAAALRHVLQSGYGLSDLRADLLAGCVVGVVALPLSMALAIACGVPPQHGLYTAIVAGRAIALLGGSRFQVSGPTAAFVVVLSPISAQFGIGGLLLATLMAGLLLLALGLTRLGGLIQFVPHPVTTGFTAGIAVVIATLQLKDFAGLEVASLPAHYAERVLALVRAAPTAHAFPSLPPLFVLPWELPGADGRPLGLSLELLRALAPSAFAIAMLGAIESLLSAVIADGMTGTKHAPDSELIAQGFGNVLAPFFGGIAATGAIARTATNIRAGARSPISALLHAGFVLLAILALAPLLGQLPMASLAALLLVVAWNMSEAKHFAHTVRVAPRSDVFVLLTCFLLTVVFDMVVSVTVGIVLAALLFMRRMAELSSVTLVGKGHAALVPPLPAGVVVYDIGGPLFFGAAQKAMSSLGRVDSSVRSVLLDVRDVPVMDATGLVNLESAVARLHRAGVMVILGGVQPQPLGLLRRAGWQSEEGRLVLCESFDDAIALARLLVPAPRPAPAAS